jgi:hypothetical protein
MRTEKTIRARLEKLRASKYRKYECDEIAALLWVLGEASSYRKGISLEIAATCTHENRDDNNVCRACNIEISIKEQDINEQRPAAKPD